MICYRCGSTLTESEFCPECGENVPGFRTQDSSKATQKRCLSATISADDAEVFARIDFVIETIDDIFASVTER